MGTCPSDFTEYRVPIIFQKAPLKALSTRESGKTFATCEGGTLLILVVLLWSYGGLLLCLSFQLSMKGPPGPVGLTGRPGPVVSKGSALGRECIHARCLIA